MKTLLLFLCLLMALPTTTLAQVAQADRAKAQQAPAAQIPTPARGFSFLNDPVNSPEEYARRIESCRTREEMKSGERSSSINLSCETLVETFNANPNFDELGDMKDYKDLAAYIRTTSFQPCPSGQMAQIARGINVDQVDYFNRPFRDGERCLTDLNKNIVISSAVCGQWLKTRYPYIFTGARDERLASNEPPKTTVITGNGPIVPLRDQAAEEARHHDLDRDRGHDDNGGGLSTGEKFGIGALIAAAVIGTACALTKCIKVSATARANSSSR